MYKLDDLVYLMQRLRDPETGCPWDKQQTFSTIVPYTMEETYELADAIERGKPADVREELGDLLFQVIFYAQLGGEQGEFTLDDVIDGITAKLVRRHPHVFPTGQLREEMREESRDDPLNKIPQDEQAIAEIKQNWEAIKHAERESKQQTSVLDDVPLALPALNRAHKLQKRAANVGFDWAQTEDIFAKLDEEVLELRAELPAGNHDRIEAEMGDLLFCCVNLSRRLGVNAEAALRRASQRFEARFRFIETSLQEQGRKPQDASLDEMETYWIKAKQQGL
jgi:ATP diphosphatase